MSYEHTPLEESQPPRTRELMVRYELSARQGLVLVCLSENGGELCLADLAHRFARKVYDPQSESIPVAFLQRIHCQLASTIIHQLERKALVEYCEKEGLVTVNTSSRSSLGV